MHKNIFVRKEISGLGANSAPRPAFFGQKNLLTRGEKSVTMEVGRIVKK